MVPAVITSTYDPFVSLNFFPKSVFATREDETHGDSGDDDEISRLLLLAGLDRQKDVCRLLSRYRHMMRIDPIELSIRKFWVAEKLLVRNMLRFDVAQFQRRDRSPCFLTADNRSSDDDHLALRVKWGCASWSATQRRQRSLPRGPRRMESFRQLGLTLQTL